MNRTSHNVTLDISNDTDGVCPHEPLVDAMPDDVARGEKFDWDRNAQGAVLAAFYYGYALIQVSRTRKYVRGGQKNDQQKRYIFQ